VLIFALWSVPSAAIDLTSWVEVIDTTWQPKHWRHWHATTCDEFQLVVSQLLIEKFSVEISHGFES
jgi:hypothetical protein